MESAGETATADELNAKQKELEAKFNTIMMKVYQAAGGAPGAGGMPGGMPGAGGMPDFGAGAAGGATDAGVDDLD